MWRNSKERADLSDLQTVMLGRIGAGKSASGNTIIGDKDTFKEGFLPEYHTSICQPAHIKVGGQKINVIDTIGLPDPTKTETETLNKIDQIFDCACDGVDVFLLVIKLGEKYTEEEKNNMKRMWTVEIFGVNVLKHTIVLFTHGDQLQESVEECLSKSDTLRSIVDHCASRYHVFNNRDKDPTQVTELQRKIESLRKMNRNIRYTKHDYEENQKKLRDEKAKREAAENQERLLKEAAEAVKEQERLRKVDEERERLLKEAAEKERERLLEAAAEAAKEQERLLRKADEERERLLKEAAEAAKEQERILRKANEERERLLKEAAAKEQEILLAVVGGGLTAVLALGLILLKKSLT